jgi:hypothetical protein
MFEMLLESLVQAAVERPTPLSTKSSRDMLARLSHGEWGFWLPENRRRWGDRYVA